MGRMLRKAGSTAALGVLALSGMAAALLRAPPIASAAEKVASGSPDPDCGSCHRDAMRNGHPVNVIPSRARVPEGWPLDNVGRLTCRTCHLDCSRGGALPTAASRLVRLRGGASGGAFCRRCHKGAAGDRRSEASKHARHYRLAHPPLVPGRDSSRACLACHDGATASPGIPGIGAPGASHPIGIAYPPPPKRYADGTYVPRAALDPRLRLFGGKVECLTCHDLYSKEDGLLVMSNRRSALCYGCHDI